MADGEEDRISSLPDHLLLEIISRIKIMDKRNEEERLMSTKEVIRTTATISKRWQHLSTRLPTLVFIKDDFMIKDEDTGGFGYGSNDVTNYFTFIDKTLAQCAAATDVVNLTKFKLEVTDLYEHDTLPVNSWIHYAITRNVQEIDLRIMGKQSLDDELFFNNSCLVSIKVSHCVVNPPNGVIRWDKLKFLCIDSLELDEDLIGKILSGSPCLETLELNKCDFDGRIAKSLFGNFGVLERFSCEMKTFERISDDDDQLFSVDFLPDTSMKLSRCVFDPPNGVIRLDKLKFLCIEVGYLDEDLIGKILSESPILETLQLSECRGFRRIDVTSKSVKNLVLSGYGCRYHNADYYIATVKINAPYISTLTIEGKMYLEEFLLENVSSLVKAHFNFRASNHFAEVLRRDRHEIDEELFRGLLLSLGHVNEIALGSLCKFISYRSSSQTYIENTNADPAVVDFKKVKSGSISRMWSSSDPEMQRKKRVASYKAYSVEDKVKGSIKRSFKWIKDRYMKIVNGFRT